MNLTMKQIKFLSELFTSSSISEAIKNTGISSATAYKWMREDDEFRRELQNRKTKALEEVSTQMQIGFSEAVEELMTIIRSSKVSAQVKINAIDSLFRNYSHLSKNALVEIESSGGMKRGSKETRISAYLRLAEMCGVDDEREKQKYMKKVSDLLEETEDIYSDDKNGK